MRIAFTGKSGAGKSSAASMVEKLLPTDSGGVLPLAFPLKEIVDDLWPKAADRRRLLQIVGAAMRAIDLDVWVNRLLRTVGSSAMQHTIIDDVRFVNEADILRRHGFTIVRILRPHNPSTLQGSEAADVSETEMDGIHVDYELVADNLEELGAQVSQLVTRLWP